MVRVSESLLWWQQIPVQPRSRAHPATCSGAEGEGGAAMSMLEAGEGRTHRAAILPIDAPTQPALNPRISHINPLRS